MQGNSNSPPLCLVERTLKNRFFSQLLRQMTKRTTDLTTAFKWFLRISYVLASNIHDSESKHRIIDKTEEEMKFESHLLISRDPLPMIFWMGDGLRRVLLPPRSVFVTAEWTGVRGGRGDKGVKHLESALCPSFQSVFRHFGLGALHAPIAYNACKNPGRKTVS